MPGSDDFEAMRRRHIARQAMAKNDGKVRTAGKRRDAGEAGRPLVLPMLGLFALVGMGLFGLTKAGPMIASVAEPYAQAAAAVKRSGMVALDGTLRRGPREPLREDGIHGWEYRSPALAHVGTEEIALSAVAAGLPGAGPLPEGVPAALAALPANEGCRVRLRAPDAEIRGVRLGGARRAGGVTMLSEDQIAAQALANVTALTDPARGPVPREPRLGTGVGSTGLGVVDVLVTETAAPVHLVLQSVGGDVLWNLHAGEGARIAAVTLVTPEHAGIAGHEGVPVDVLRTADGCAPAPERAPAPHWRMVRNLGGLGALEKVLTDWQDRHDAYAAWYESVFGVPADAFTIRHARADHVLVGPVPEAPVPFTPLAARTAAVTAEDHVLHGPAEARAAEAGALHEALMLRAAGGALTALDPEPLMREPS